MEGLDLTEEQRQSMREEDSGTVADNEREKTVPTEEEHVHALEDVDAREEQTEDEASEAGPSEVELLNAQIQDLQNKLLRAHADFDNFRRRTRQEKEELSLYAGAKLVTDLLPVLDNFSLALKSAASTGESDGLAKGVDMVFKQLQSVLEAAGLRAMEAVGQAFDPNLHEAVVSEKVEDQEPGIVLEVLRPGYFLKDKVLRAAMVKVSE